MPAAISELDIDLSETDLRHPRAKYRAVRAASDDRRGWLKEAPVCPILDRYQIAHLGLVETPHPFQIVRTKLEGSYFLACYSGRGRVLVDGRWKICRPGQAFLLPPGILHAFHSLPGKPWVFGWVRYRERPGQMPVAAANSPVLADFAGESLRNALIGFHAECSGTPIPANLLHWIELIQNHVIHFAQPGKRDDRVWEMWQQVERELEDDWPSARMAEESHLGEKQLERLCRRELGRTPRQHLIWLRMRRAAELLTEGQPKIATVAHAVGYRNAFVFSSTFKRVMGWSPSEYPGRK